MTKKDYLKTDQNLLNTTENFLINHFDILEKTLQKTSK